MRYCLGPPDSYGPIWAALAFMPFGLFFDFMDGKVARWRKKSSLMGQELDSLADLVRQRSIWKDVQSTLCDPSWIDTALGEKLLAHGHPDKANTATDCSIPRGDGKLLSK